MLENILNVCFKISLLGLFIFLVFRIFSDYIKQDSKSELNLYFVTSTPPVIGFFSPSSSVFTIEDQQTDIRWKNKDKEYWLRRKYADLTDSLKKEGWLEWWNLESIGDGEGVLLIRNIK